MRSRQLSLQIRRFNPDRHPSEWLQTFHLELREKTNLLEALLRIQEEQDGSLAFRYSCRGAVCGSCAMRVDRRLVLACRTHVEDLLGRPVMIEPLPYFPVLRDLVVDMSLLFIHYRKIQPYLHGKSTPSEGEYLMDVSSRRAIDPYINCILCGICFGSCPAFRLDRQFLGPAMLAKAYRFFIDPRDCRAEEIFENINGQRGVWGCKTVFNCVKVCPKEVPPTHAIVRLRNEILRRQFGSLLSRLTRLKSLLSL